MEGAREAERGSVYAAKGARRPRLSALPIAFVGDRLRDLLSGKASPARSRLRASEAHAT